MLWLSLHDMHAAPVPVSQEMSKGQRERDLMQYFFGAVFSYARQ